MASEPAQTTVDTRTSEAVDTLKKTYGLEYRSDAVKVALRRGLSDLGFLGGGPVITPARRLTREIGKVLLIVSATLVTLSITGGLGFIGPAVGVFAGAIGVFAADRWVLHRLEPRLTARLPRVQVSDRRDAW